MASGVFGVPITVHTVRATGDYHEPITQKDVADLAKRMMNAGGRDIDAQIFVDNLKGRYGNGISTKCLIYNATGTDLRFIASNDWHGGIYDTPYPSIIQNGQWGAFLHIHPGGALVGSAGAVVYRSRTPDNTSSCDWMFCWSIPYTGVNRVYTEIREQGHFPQHWNYIYGQRLEMSGQSSTDNGYEYLSTTNIGEGTTVNARAVFEHPY